jgi:Skp family chaperone for outer membrane proteins
VKKLLFVAAAVIALCGMGYVGTFVAAEGPVVPAAGDNKPTLKVGVVNITRVIKDFKKANTWGDRILNQAKKYETELKAEQEALNGREAKLATLQEHQKEAELKALRQAKMLLQDKDTEYQKDIRKKRDEMAVEINCDIGYIIDNISRQKGLELVLTCPDVADLKEMHSLSDAMRRMTAPAVWVAWKHPGLDITKDVVDYLNYYRKEETIGDGGVAPFKAPTLVPAGAAIPGRPNN